MPGEALRARGRLTSAADRRSALWLLVGSLAVLQFAYPATLDGRLWTLLYLSVYIGLVVVAVRIGAADPRRFWPLVAAAAALVAGATWFAVQQDDLAATRAMLAGSFLLQLALMVALLDALVHPPAHATVTDLILVAVAIYLLFGGVCGLLSAQLELAAPGSFVDQTASGEPLAWQGLIYGSYVTLTTLGFGDIVPLAPWARALWSFEAVVGTLYLAIVIARLVGLGGSHTWLRGRDTRAPGPDEP
ncbi:potassium channel family protein [Demequina lignilytica]|uniref:Potassium channel family protein n=1 Tax=Demequina lignilytica TaxID=3051663 RepID=A0AB35MEI6_9MICO|nr:potassium channel family protein [Demequina sp. SYSU T0a273]MDN4482164.1 potassium channel family protein [Demequina sp. SYSU T0a273]